MKFNDFMFRALVYSCRKLRDSQDYIRFYKRYSMELWVMADTMMTDVDVIDILSGPADDVLTQEMIDTGFNEIYEKFYDSVIQRSQYENDVKIHIDNFIGDLNQALVERGAA